MKMYKHVDFSFCLDYLKELDFSGTEQFFLLNTSFRQSSWLGFIWWDDLASSGEAKSGGLAKACVQEKKMFCSREI